MPLRVYNTLTRQKEDFQTVRPGKVGMYVCGPTVYKPSHVGHMVGPVIFDTVKRYLTYLGYEVTWVVNITDVDDKLIKRAHDTGTTVKELAERMTADYLDCLKKLNVTGIDHMPKATEHIAEMIGIMKGLIEKGYAYAAGGDVYFDISKDHDYGKLCNRDPEQLEAGARIEVSEKKRNPGDFALWKGSKPGEPAWPSPWGPGRPGWHIECSAMSMKLIGETLDIHGGGLDLQFPHHENELAQSESFTSKPFALAWMHNGLLKMGTAKMAGSVGNVVNVVDLLKQYNPETVRFLLLGTHYRSPIEWSEDRLEEVRKSLEGFYRFFERFERITGENFYSISPPLSKKDDEKALRDYIKQFQEDEIIQITSHHFLMFMQCMDDDFNTGGAIGWLNNLLTALNRFVDEQGIEKTQSVREFYIPRLKYAASILRELAQILGLFLEPPQKKKLGGDDALVSGLMQLLIDVRNNLRAEAKKIATKDDPVKKALFEQTDVIRKRLGEIGVTLEDRPGGTGWRVG
jgi:cysteinyl-tRNA synthetase